jgi:transposase-like protein
MAGKTGMTHYPIATKQEAIRLFYEEGKTRSEITNMLGLRDQQRVKMWVKQYRKEGESLFTKHIGRPCKNVETQEAELKRLRMENTLLKKLQSELRKDILAKRDIGQFSTTKKNSK